MSTSNGGWASEGTWSASNSGGWASDGTWSASNSGGWASNRSWSAPNGGSSASLPEQVAPEPTPSLYDQSTIREIEIKLEDATNWQTRLGCNRRFGPGGDTPSTDEDFPASLEIDGVRLDRIGVRCKGNSSLSITNNKKPFNLTMDAFVDGQELWGFDVVNLNNNWNDPSQLREALSLRLLGIFMPTPRSAFAKVTFEGEYLGVYLMVEQVDSEFTDFWYPHEDDGLMIKGDSPERIAFNSSALTWEGENLSTYKSNYEVKGRAAGTDEGYITLRETIRALDAPVSAGGLSEADFVPGVQEVLDVDAALWYLAGNNYVGNFDSYYAGKNFYFYRGDDDGRFRMIPWDFGLSHGLFGLRGSQDGGFPGDGGTPPATVDPLAQSDDAGRPLVRRLLTVPQFRADYYAHYRAIMAAYTPDTVAQWGHTLQDLITPAIQAEIDAQGRIGATYTFEQFETNLEDDISIGGRQGGFRTAPGLVSFMTERSEILTPLPELAAPDVVLAGASHAPAAPTTADTVTISVELSGSATVESVELRYRVDAGPEHRTHMLGDSGTWLAEIPPQRAGADVSYFVRVGLDGRRAEFFPAANQTQPFRYEVAGVEIPDNLGGDLVINEVMAANEATVADANGEFEDWIELYNRGAAPINLEGIFLSDDPMDPWAFALPPRVLAPGEHLVVWCDGDPEDGVLHAPFRIDRAGEDVVLTDSEFILDRVELDEQSTDVSYAREVDGGETWVACESPTPGETNLCRPAGNPPAPIFLPFASAGD